MYYLELYLNTIRLKDAFFLSNHVDFVKLDRHLRKTLPKAQRTRGLSSAYQSNKQ